MSGTEIVKRPSHLCLEEEDALLLRRALGDRELRELEFEELRSERDAGGRGEGLAHACTHARMVMLHVTCAHVATIVSPTGMIMISRTSMQL